MLEIDHGAGQPYQGPERRYAFFPRRLCNDRDGIPRELQGADRRSGKDRRRRDADDPLAKQK